MTLCLTIGGPARTVKQKDQDSTRGAAHMLDTINQMTRIKTVDTGIHIKRQMTKQFVMRTKRKTSNMLIMVLRSTSKH
eukprot:12126078-Heterocapsa_arctica.AAC.1